MALTYKKYEHGSHMGLGIANLLFLLSSIIAFTIEYIGNLSILEIGWMLANIFLYSGFWIIILALLIAQFDKLPPYSHLITVLTGILIGLITNLDNVDIYYEGDSISASYSIFINLCGGLIFIVFIIIALNPLIKKVSSNKVKIKKKQYFLLLIAYSFVIFWVITLFLTNFEVIRVMRRFSLSLGMFLWALALYIDPLTIVISKAKIQKVIILTKTGLPIFSYDFEKDAEMKTSSDLLAGILSAIKSGIEEILTSGKSLKTMAFEDSIMNFMNGNHVVLLLLSQQTISSNTKLIAKVFLETFEKKYKGLLKENVIDEQKMGDVADLLQEVMESVQL